MRYTLTVEGKPVNQQDFYEQKHWSGRATMAKAVHAMVAVAHMQQDGGEKPEFGYPVDITIIGVFTGRLYDSSNVYAKVYEDGLVRCGILPNDNPKYVRSVRTRSMRAQHGEDRVVIIVDDDTTDDWDLSGMV